MPGKPSADDDEDEDAPVETESGGASGGGGSDIAELLLDLTCATVKAAIMLAEADRETWDQCAGRMGALRSAIASLPSKPPPRKRVGFVPPKPTRKRR